MKFTEATTRGSRFRSIAIVTACTLFAGAIATSPSTAAPQRIPVPELEGATGWIGVDGPLRLRDLRGKIVVIDFWTHCCINCMHILPDLAKLEEKYGNQVVVIGVHTGKFKTEKDEASIRKAIDRYKIHHPVANDGDGKLWTRFAVQYWPTVFIIDPEGFVVAKLTGEQNIGEQLEKNIPQLIRVLRARKTLNEKPLPFQATKAAERGDGPLYFPGKILADPKNDRLFVADSTHNRIVITDMGGKMIAIAGSGEQGFTDGPFAKASFWEPQGMALKDNVLYVADRKNHAIRALDLTAKTVRVVAGTGHQNHQRRAGAALRTGLNSPWDLTFHNDLLFIAMAGHHQIWTLDLDKHWVAAFAGTGNENIVDGPNTTANFAQPSGLTTDGKTLFVADSEVSAIRAVSLQGAGVATIVGKGLFDFGDVDGVGPMVRIQHPLGIVYVDGLLYVADTYNSKIKVIDPRRRSSTTFAGGTADEPLFNEPGGISYAEGKLYVADTNAHRIRVVDLKSKEVTTLELKGVEAPKKSEEP